MIKFLKEILFNSVLVVILLHTFIPHPHSSEMTEREHIKLHNKSNTLLEIISIAFHESNDENLDNLIVAKYKILKKTKEKYQYPTITIQNINPSGIEETTIEEIVKKDIDNFNEIFIVKLNGVRGPPFIA